MNDKSHEAASPTPGLSPWQRKWHEVIFEADTPAGKAFGVALLVLIMLSVLVVMLEVVSPREAE